MKSDTFMIFLAFKILAMLGTVTSLSLPLNSTLPYHLPPTNIPNPNTLPNATNSLRLNTDDNESTWPQPPFDLHTDEDEPGMYVLVCNPVPGPDAWITKIIQIVEDMEYKAWNHDPEIHVDYRYHAQDENHMVTYDIRIPVGQGHGFTTADVALTLHNLGSLFEEYRMVASFSGRMYWTEPEPVAIGSFSIWIAFPPEVAGSRKTN